MSRRPLLVYLGAFFAAAPGHAVAQELELRRTLPAVEWAGCPTTAVPRPVGAPERQEAERLVAAATQASILGHSAEAAALLAQAAEVNPASASIFERLARTEDRLGHAESAVAAYCRYLSLAPDAPDAEEVQGRIDALARPAGVSVPAASLYAFRTGIEHYDAGRLGAAEASFGLAADAAPAWSDPLYNRALIRLALDRRDLAADDLRHYLELSPGSPEFSEILDLLGALRGVVVTQRSPGGAFAAGLLLPGLGHFTTGRPGRGVAFLTAAGAAAAAGLAVQRVNVQCLAPTVDDACPAGQVLREETERPYLLPGLGAGLAIGLWGAVDAYRGARRENERARDLLRMGSRSGGLVVAAPRLVREGDTTRFELVRLRF